VKYIAQAQNVLACEYICVWKWRSHYYGAREYGSGGATIAGLLAKRLGWRLVDDLLIAEIAGTPKPNRETVQRYDESVDLWFHRIMKALWRGGFQGSASTIEEEAFDADAIAQLWHRVILETAKIGNCVAVGL
jgi:hypothetical protein